MSYIPAVADLTSMLTVVINEDQPEHTATFTVPESLLVGKSDFFKAACRNGWQEATSRIIKVPDVDVAAFHAYLHLVYTEKVGLSSKVELTGDPFTMAKGRPVLIELVHLWLLADRLADTQLRNVAINGILLVTDHLDPNGNLVEGFPPDITNLIWSKTTAGRSLRRLVLDLYEFWVVATEMEQVKDEYCPEFIKDMMMNVLRRQDEEEIVNCCDREACYYHEHFGDETTLCTKGILRLE